MLKSWASEVPCNSGAVAVSYIWAGEISPDPKDARRTFIYLRDWSGNTIGGVQIKAAEWGR
jgi:hypothetical protein